MDVLETIRESWGWTGIEPKEVVAMNSFGNLLVRDCIGAVWRICPEDLHCRVVAANDRELEGLLEDPEFVRDWEMRRLVDAARVKLGSLQPGRCYCLRVPAAIGGDYEEHNLATLRLEELIAVSGSIAKQVKDAPPGTRIELKLID